MRSVAVLVLAIAGFVAFVHRTHERADELMDREAAALSRTRALAGAAGRATVEQEGYRFEWVTGQGLPDLLVARPKEHGSTGTRWFASTDGATVYAFEVVLLRARENRPDVAPLRRFLALSPERRRDPTGAGGWRQAR